MYTYVPFIKNPIEAFICWTDKKKNYHKTAWIGEIAASQIVADRKGNGFIVEKIVKNCYAFYYYHCYLSILAVLSIKIIDSLGSLSCR